MNSLRSSSSLEPGSVGQSPEAKHDFYIFKILKKESESGGEEEMGR